ncbi:protein FAR1-RELATED SEQUENCE 5 isoform X3 [Lolium perenne]|uniref:protein FAR1-RELATED SEQUENCE 5 isoform X3 n=1 Tax=Lolium perenne TaxID=4522 RepID=UPI0021F59504|nr:protein FAR1-RELATED SEQUENCE 5-like isoform X3 [Lolium perenne]
MLRWTEQRETSKCLSWFWNHTLHLPETLHLMVSQRKISELQAFEIGMADDAGIRPKASHELASRQVGGRPNLSYTLRDHKNYLRTKCQREMAYGQAGSMLKYFQDKIAENPSFQYALQMDCEEQIANIFWVDAKMNMDYAHFGDVVSFDTTFGTNKESRLFGVFVGFNHFRETVVFGAALMYDETFASFKWLFEAFLNAHKGKAPKTFYTDQDAAMGKAVGEVFAEVWHGLCTFHIMQNAAKHLHVEKDEEKKKDKKKEKKKEKEKNKDNKTEENEETGILSDFSACMFEYEDMEEFEQKFDLMRKKVSKQTWLDSIYKLKEKWAECYMKDVFRLGMRSTQLSESFNNDLKIHFKSDFDIIRFFKHFERMVQGKRNTELNSEFESRKKLPKLCMRRPPPMLVQASKLYTPGIFDAFQGEYERSLLACTKTLDGCNEYLVGDFTFEEEYKVIGDPLKQIVVCSCQQFDKIGILCGHALKVLDLMNIKSLPPHYVLKRWTREARNGTVQDKEGRNIIENPNMDAMLSYRYMSRKFHNLADRASNFPECVVLVDSTLDILGKQIEEKINACTSTPRFPGTSVTDASPPNELLSNARLKKKEVETKTSKRRRSWLDKKHKIRKKRENQTTSHFGEEIQEVLEEARGDSAQVANDNVCTGKENESKVCDGNLSFTQLLTGPIIDDVFTRLW